MNKKELTQAVATATGTPQTDANKAIDAILTSIAYALSKGEEIKLVGFGTFSVTHRMAKTGRNPRTGQEIKIPATKVIKFKAGKNLKDSINS